MEEASLLPVLAVTVGLSLLAVVVVATTSFVKISVVLFIVRNALGIQQTPPNIVLYGIALVLTGFISAPVVTKVYDRVTQPDVGFETFDELVYAAQVGSEPVHAFMTKFTHDTERAFFVSATQDIWDDELDDWMDGDSLLVLAPAFLLTELKRAFEIGFLIFLPFVVIDLIVTTLLMAMGMMMVSPTIISTPFKLLLFVGVDGWSRLVHGLVLSYA